MANTVLIFIWLICIHLNSCRNILNRRVRPLWTNDDIFTIKRQNSTSSFVDGLGSRQRSNTHLLSEDFRVDSVETGRTRIHKVHNNVDVVERGRARICKVHNRVGSKERKRTPIRKVRYHVGSIGRGYYPTRNVNPDTGLTSKGNGNSPIPNGSQSNSFITCDKEGNCYIKALGGPQDVDDICTYCRHLQLTDCIRLFCY